MTTRGISRRSWSTMYSGDALALIMHFVGIFLIALLTWFLSVTVAVPSATTMRTEYELAYLPVKYEVVSGVTNVFSVNQVLGGSGGVGLPQLERTLRDFEDHEDPDTLYYVTVSLDYESVEVDYYDFQTGKVVHAQYRNSDLPTYKNLGIIWGYFSPTKAAIDGQKLVVDRDYVLDVPILLFFLLLVTFLSVAYFFGLAPFINGFCYNLSKKYRERR